MTAALEMASVSAGYGAVGVLQDVQLSVGPNEAVALLGANGAGKTTLLRAISGIIPHSGSIKVQGVELTRHRTVETARAGIAHVPEGRGTIAALSVEDNLRVGALSRPRSEDIKSRIERAYDLFPVLAKRRSQPAGQLSGGEQQMLAISRALMLAPILLLLDEPSIGLAPRVTQEVFETIARIRAEEPMGILLVEQNARLALQVTDRVYVLANGRVVDEGAPEKFSDPAVLRDIYLGGKAAML